MYPVAYLYLHQSLYVFSLTSNTDTYYQKKKTTEVNKRQLPRNFLLLGEKLQTASFTLSHLLLLSWSAAPWPSFGRHHSFSTGVRSRPLARPDYGGNAESSAAANSGTSSLRSHRRIQRRLGSSA